MPLSLLSSKKIFFLNIEQNEVENNIANIFSHVCIFFKYNLFFNTTSCCS